MPFADPEVARAYNTRKHREYREAFPERHRAHGRRARVRNGDKIRAADRAHKYDRRRTLDGWARHILANSKSKAKRDGKYRAVLCSIEELTLRVRDWSGHCDCCGEPGLTFCWMPAHSVKTAAHVEHDHVTGALRGFCCRRCNATLAVLDDSKRVSMCREYKENSQ